MKQKKRIYYTSCVNGNVKSSVSYRKNDVWSYTAGANIFFEKENFSFLGQHQATPMFG